MAVESSAGGRRRSRSSTPRSAASSPSTGSSVRKTWRPFSMSRPCSTQARRIAIHSGGKRPPCVATPTSAVVGPSGSASATLADHRHALLRLAGARRVEDRDDVVAPVAEHAAHRLPVVRVAGEALSEQQIPHGLPSPGSSGGSCTPSTNGTPGHGSCASRRLPSRSTWSKRDATCAPAEMPSPDSTMQPSMQPSPSARAACTIRTASRIPPDFASLTLIPCARSAHAATSASVWQSSST